MLHHFTEKIQAAEMELFLMQSALERAVNSLISSTVCTIELEAPVAKSMLTMNVHAHKVGDALDQGCCFSSSANGPPVPPQASVPLHSPQAHHLCSRLHDYNTNTWQITCDA